MAVAGVLEILIKTKDEVSSGLSAAENNVKKSGNKLSSWTIAKGQLIADFAKKAIGTTAEIMKDTVKSAVKAYADYEQLAGGIDTLFGEDTAKKVKFYAQQAYMSAGISANQYMETVTAFSASLLQSLGGDTDQAAEIANMAMIDMADNVNKMGSSMESVENAYKGFAKQNYTMLDNLKLGYGGTKKEMERLLEDASKLTGEKYDIKNLSDVYKAIHAIQEKMEITGTTQHEAMTTVSGSFNAAKAAWQNVLVAMGSGKGVKSSIKKFAQTAKTAIKNVAPVVTNAISGLFEGAKEILPDILEVGGDIVNELGRMIFGKDWDITIDWIQNAWSDVQDAFNVAIEWVGNAYQVTIEWLQNAWQTISDAFTEAGKWIGNAFDTTVNWVQNAWSDVSSAFETAGEWVGKAFDTTINFVRGLWDDVSDAISKASKDVYDSVVNFTLGLFKGITDFIASIPEAINVAVNFVKKVIDQTGQNVQVAGENTFGDDWSAEDAMNYALNGTLPDDYNAKGNWNVPYDNFHSLLHRGEMVLTASQARNYRDEDIGGSSEIVSAIQSLKNEMANMKIMVGKKVFGRTVVDYGGRRMSDYIGNADSRAAAGYGT